jgi:hypothetical protein
MLHVLPWLLLLLVHPSMNQVLPWLLLLLVHPSMNQGHTSKLHQVLPSMLQVHAGCL